MIETQVINARCIAVAERAKEYRAANPKFPEQFHGVLAAARAVVAPTLEAAHPRLHVLEEDERDPISVSLSLLRQMRSLADPGDRVDWSEELSIARVSSVEGVADSLRTAIGPLALKYWKMFLEESSGGPIPDSLQQFDKPPARG
jgi:hypothetical protein